MAVIAIFMAVAIGTGDGGLFGDRIGKRNRRQMGIQFMLDHLKGINPAQFEITKGDGQPGIQEDIAVIRAVIFREPGKLGHCTGFKAGNRRLATGDKAELIMIIPLALRLTAGGEVICGAIILAIEGDNEVFRPVGIRNTAIALIKIAAIVEEAFGKNRAIGLIGGEADGGFAKTHFHRNGDARAEFFRQLIFLAEINAENAGGDIPGDTEGRIEFTGRDGEGTEIMLQVKLLDEKPLILEFAVIFRIADRLECQGGVEAGIFREAEGQRGFGGVEEIVKLIILFIGIECVIILDLDQDFTAELRVFPIRKSYGGEQEGQRERIQIRTPTQKVFRHFSFLEGTTLNNNRVAAVEPREAHPRA